MYKMQYIKQKNLINSTGSVVYWIACVACDSAVTGSSPMRGVKKICFALDLIFIPYNIMCLRQSERALYRDR